MIIVSFNKEAITVNVSIHDDNIYAFARDYALDQGLDLREFDDLTVESQY